MSPLQIADELADLFHELREELHAPANLTSLAKQLSCFAAFTRAAASAGPTPLLKHCFEVADRWLRADDAHLTRAIQCSYLDSLHLDATARGGQLARQLMPPRLHGEYLSQQYASLP